MQISPGARETRITTKMSNSIEMSTYEFLNLTFAESTLAKFEDLKPYRINTYIKIGRGHGLIGSPKRKARSFSGDGPLRGTGLSVVVAQVAARGLCGPRPEAFRSVSSPPRYGLRRSCIARFVWRKSLRMNTCTKMGWGVPQQFIETQSCR